MATALSYPTISGVTGAPYLSALTDTANIQDTINYLYYGSTKAVSISNGIYGMLTNLQSQISAVSSGINVHESAKFATATTLAATYAAGTADASGGTGISASITFSATGVQKIDSATINLALNDRVLVKDGTTALSGTSSIANGIYYVSTAPAVGVAGILTRALDSDNSISGEMAEGDFLYVSDGDTNANEGYILTTSSATGTGPAGSIKIGTDSVTYTQFVGVGSYYIGTTAAQISPTSGQALAGIASVAMVSGGGGTFTLSPASSASSFAITLPAAADTLIGKATTDVLTNKSLSDSTTYFVDNSDNTKRLNIDVTGTTGITGILQTAFTTAKTIAFPDTAGTVALTGQTFYIGTQAIGVTAASGTITSLPGVTSIAGLTTIGTIGTGVWQGTAIGPTYGGTNQTSYAKGDLLYASAINTLSKLAVPTTDGWVLTYNSTSALPEWRAAAAGGSGFTGAGTAITNITGAASNSMTITSAASGNGNLSLVSAGTGTVSLDTAGAATASIANTNATTVNIAGSAGTVSIASTATSSKTVNIGTSGTAAGSTSINIGTSAATASTTVLIGNSTLSTTSDIKLQGAVYVGKATSASSTGTVSGYNSSIYTPITTNTNTGIGASATGGHLYIYSGDATLNANSQGTATVGNLNLDTGNATTSLGTAIGGTINIGQFNAATIVLGSTSTSYTFAPTTITINGTVSGHTLSGTLVGATSSTSIAPLRLPTGTVPSSGNQQFGMIAAAAESLQLATTKTTGAGPGFGYIRAPQIVYTVANTNTVTTNTAASVFDAANDVLSSLEVAKAYRFRGTYYVTSTFTSGTAAIQLLFAFANSPVAFKYNFKTYKSSGTAMDQVGLITTNAASSVSAGVTATATYVIEFEGFFTSNATTGGTFTPQIQMSGAGSSTVVNSGSWFEVEKLGTSTQTLIAGNWG